MTKAVGDDESMYKSLQEVVHLFELAQTSVFKLMSSVSLEELPHPKQKSHSVLTSDLKDSVPKFLRDPKYSVVLQEHDVDIFGSARSYSPTPGVPERSMSRSARS